MNKTMLVSSSKKLTKSKVDTAQEETTARAKKKIKEVADKYKDLLEFDTSGKENKSKELKNTKGESIEEESNSEGLGINITRFEADKTFPFNEPFNENYGILNFLAMQMNLALIKEDTAKTGDERVLTSEVINLFNQCYQECFNTGEITSELEQYCISFMMKVGLSIEGLAILLGFSKQEQIEAFHEMLLKSTNLEFRVSYKALAWEFACMMMEHQANLHLMLNASKGDLKAIEVYKKYSQPIGK